MQKNAQPGFVLLAVIMLLLLATVMVLVLSRLAGVSAY